MPQHAIQERPQPHPASRRYRECKLPGLLQERTVSASRWRSREQCSRPLVELAVAPSLQRARQSGLQSRELRDARLAAGIEPLQLRERPLLDRRNRLTERARSDVLRAVQLKELCVALHEGLLGAELRVLERREARGEGAATRAWLGPKGTVSPTHRDPTHNLLVQAVGSKYVRLYAPSQERAMYLFADPKRANAARADPRAALEEAHARRFPEFSRAPFSDAVLEPGDALYIPPGWFHYVQSVTSSFSVSFWWT